MREITLSDRTLLPIGVACLILGPCLAGTWWVASSNAETKGELAVHRRDLDRQEKVNEELTLEVQKMNKTLERILGALDVRPIRSHNKD